MLHLTQRDWPVCLIAEQIIKKPWIDNRSLVYSKGYVVWLLVWERVKFKPLPRRERPENPEFEKDSK